MSEPPFKSKKVFFPITGNPVGFHHLLLAECVLQQFQSVKEVRFILSNGIHPDPQKNTKIPEKTIRLELVQHALQDFTNPQYSSVAQIAAQHGIVLKLTQGHYSIDTSEFERERAFFLVDHIQRLSDLSKMHIKIPVVVGSDLIQRMSNPQIFSESNLKILQTQCVFLIAAREGNQPELVIQELQQNRKITFDFTPLTENNLNPCLHPFLKLSSSAIRNAVRSKSCLKKMLPASVISRVHQFQLYG